MREQIRQLILQAIPQAKDVKFDIGYPDSRFGDYSTNVAMLLKKDAQTIVEKIDKSMFEKVEVAGGFINFWVKSEQFLQPTTYNLQPKSEGKILLEYFQPNIAKPLHVGHLRTAIIGDCLKRMLLHLGYRVESDTHMGDWGTQFGFLILAYKKFGEVNDKLYAQLNADESQKEAAKQEFVKLEQGDKENRKIWQGLVDASVKEFLKINELVDILPFDHHWPESFYEDKMPAVIAKLKELELLEASQGAQVVNLEKNGLGVAIIIKSDGGTTYLLRDLATFVFAKQQGFTQHLYVVDNRQALHYKQLFAILKLMGEIPPLKEGETRGVHIDYGFVSFKGEALSTRKGNLVLVSDLIVQAEQRVSRIIEEKNPKLKDKQEVVKAVSKAALKFYDLMHNRHSDIEFDWNEALNFEGKSGPYIQYTCARLNSILKKAQFSISNFQFPKGTSISETEHRILFLSSILDEKVEEAMQDYLPNIFANYLYELASEVNKFYHESPVIKESDENKKAFRLNLVAKAKETLAKGLDLLGIKALKEM